MERGKRGFFCLSLPNPACSSRQDENSHRKWLHRLPTRPKIVRSRAGRNFQPVNKLEKELFRNQAMRSQNLYCNWKVTDRSDTSNSILIIDITQTRPILPIGPPWSTQTGGSNSYAVLYKTTICRLATTTTIAQKTAWSNSEGRRAAPSADALNPFQIHLETSSSTKKQSSQL